MELLHQPYNEMNDTIVSITSHSAPAFCTWLRKAAGEGSPQRLQLVYSGSEAALQEVMDCVAAACGRAMHTLSLHVEPNIPFHPSWVTGFAGLKVLRLKLSCERITLG